MKKKDIEKLVEETMNSFDGSSKAEPKPFLLTRINSRLQTESDKKNIWTKLGSILSTPAVAFASLAAIIILNVAIIMQTPVPENNTTQTTTPAKDEFAINVISIYDFENQEP